MGRGTIEANKLRTEGYKLTPLTSDPAATQEGDVWLRGDVAPETDQIGSLRLDTGGSTVDIPVWAASATTSSDIAEHLRVPVGSTQGFVATQASGAAYPQLGVWDSGTRYGAHDLLFAIPDSVVSRDPDDATSGDDASLGLVFTTSVNWVDIQARISGQQTTASDETMVIGDTTGSIIQSIDVSGLSSNDIVTFKNINLSAGNQYSVYMDSTNARQRGYDTDPSYPYPSNDNNLSIDNGFNAANFSTASDAYGISEIGNINL